MIGVTNTVTDRAIWLFLLRDITSWRRELELGLWWCKGQSLAG